MLLLSFFCCIYPPEALAQSAPGADDLKTVIWRIVGTILRAAIPLSFVIGAIVIGLGVKRFADGNSAPHGGKGALVKISVGALIMMLKTTSEIILNTLIRAGAGPQVQMVLDMIR